MDMKHSLRQQTAALVKGLTGGDVKHGVAMLAMNRVQEQGGRTTVVTVGNIVMEEPLGGDKSFDLALCDVYIVPRTVKQGISGNVCVSEAQIDVLKHIEEMIKGG